LGDLELLEYVKELIDEFESNSQIRSRADAFRALRSLGLDDCGEFLWTIPNQEYPKLSRLLPSMPNEDIQQNWTGNTGIALLKLTTTFIRSVSYNYSRLTSKGLENATILDYGCGYGRIARLMYKFTEEEKVFGVDPWDRAIAICHDSGLLSNYFVSDYLPTSLPVGSVPFDLIYAFSVFTHLSERATFASLRVLRRYISNRGILVITIRPVEYWHCDPHTSVAQKAILIERHRTVGFAFQPHNRERIDGDITYGDTSMTLDWLADNFPEWSIDSADRSLEDPLQRYIFLSPRR
jgi:SAM-dependent methyltransferase